MKCIMCNRKINKKLMDKETRTCYSCIVNLEQRIEEFKFINDYECNN